MPILGDTTAENDETFFLTLVETDAIAVFETTSAVGTILNDDIPNSPPEGIVAITGEPFVNAQLIADASTLVDQDGLGALTFTWLRNSLPIAGASGVLYRLTNEDLGASVSVRVSYTDGLDNAEFAESESTVPVGVNLDGGSNADVLVGSVGNDRIRGSNADDTLLATRVTTSSTEARDSMWFA